MEAVRRPPLALAGEETNNNGKTSAGDETGHIGAPDSSSEEGDDLRRGQRKPGQCLPKSRITPELIIKSDGLALHIQYMKDHTLIAKFVGIWPVENS